MEKSSNTKFKEPMPRRVPALVTYLHPFRLVYNDTSYEWAPTIEQINTYSWDYVKLHEIVGGIDVGLEAPYHMVIGFDGALALPPIPELRSAAKSVEFFNRCLGALLLGGIYCEAVTLDHVELGTILDWKYIRVQGQAMSFANQFHFLTRMKMCPPIHAIGLMSPKILFLEELIKCTKNGNKILSLVNELNPEFLLRGTTNLARQDWSLALVNLWIVVEELTSNIWNCRILSNQNEDKDIPGRKDQLKDNRSWSISLKHELLYQLKVLTKEDLELSFTTRKARNELIHQGKYPNKDAALAAFKLINKLLFICTGQEDIALFKLNLEDHTLSDPFNPKFPSKLEPQYWMPIPKLPGEEAIEQEEAVQRKVKK